MQKPIDVFITGSCGMVGSHMMEILAARNLSIVGSYYKPTVDLKEINTTMPMIECDVRYPNMLETIIEKYRPAKIFHLAAQSYPVVSWSYPNETMHTNANGTINVFEAIKKVRALDASYDPVVVVACSSAQYGASIKDTIVTEEAQFLPLHPYGVSKVAQDLLSYQYFVNDGIRSIRARIFNTTGPRKVNDVVSDFSARVVEIEKGKSKVLRVGNLTTRRAILDVVDLVNALWLLSEKGQPGEAYNICGEKVYLIADIIKMMSQIVGFEIEYEQDPALMRKTDEPIILGDTTKLRAATGWACAVSFEDTLKRVINYYRKK